MTQEPIIISVCTSNLFAVTETCTPRDVAVWSDMQLFLEKRIRDSCDTVMTNTKDMVYLKQTPELFGHDWSDESGLC